VVDEETGSPDTSQPDRRYIWGKYYCEIKVETDGIFKYDHLYAGRGVGHIGDRVDICYDPEDPDEYYFAGYYSNGRTVAVFTWGLSGINIVLSLIFFIYYNKQLFFQRRRKAIKS
jgi:hypothetical protein